MGERIDNRTFKDYEEAVGQMVLGKRKLREVAPLLGNTLHIVDDPLFTLGNETEPYNEGMLDKWIEELCGSSPTQKLQTYPRRKRNITKTPSA